MPELPEVETIKLKLQKYLIGHTVKDIKVNFEKKVKGEQKLIKGKKIIGVDRFGKMIVVNFAGLHSMIIHPKMTGQMLYKGPNLTKPFFNSPKITGGVPGRHTVLELVLDKNGHFYFNDYRRFGWVEFCKTSELKENHLIKTLGPEPGKDLSVEYLKNLLLKTKRAVKLLLLDQSKISGVGNIYACDSLWLAKIHPSTPANQVADKADKILNAIKQVFKEGIKNGGSSENAYVTPDGGEGNYQNKTLVYGRQGQPCKRCKTLIKKYKLSGRGTYFCPSCQPLKKQVDLFN